MAKTRDLAKATLDQLKYYLHDNFTSDKTGPELAYEILIHLRKFRKPGQQRKYGNRKTRDLAEATLNQVRRYLENPKNVKGKTAFKLSGDILVRFFVGKFREPGRRHKWRYGSKEFYQLIYDIIAVCPKAFVLYLSRARSSRATRSSSRSAPRRNSTRALASGSTAAP
jgi:hypothetical protein